VPTISSDPETKYQNVSLLPAVRGMLTGIEISAVWFGSMGCVNGVMLSSLTMLPLSCTSL
jgi:TctA family transporter